MDEPESFDSEMTELQECSYEASEALSQDDEDEVEELQNSLREVVQDHSVKPKLQCLMVDPSFSMVTVQSEDSGIVWETASSRCSTPWASETSSVSEGGSMEGSGGAGNITIIFDEEKVVRRRVRRLSDRFSRPGSSRSASALGVERLEMMEVSQPNIKQDKKETEPDLEEIKSTDQQLFSLISEGYEILNIRVPSKLPTVDEEENTELQDNLSYLDQTPMIKSRNHQMTTAEDADLHETETQNEESKEVLSHPPTDSSLKVCPTEGPGDIDYFEKFTLLDVVAPDEQTIEEQEETVTPVPTPEPEQTTPKVVRKNISPSASEESFVFVPDVDIVGEHLDEVFYGEGPPADLVPRDDKEAKAGRMRRQSSVKESGSVLFESEETVLTPIYISSGPPKIIDPILLEEPTAMSFMYSDLYEDAMGERTRSDEEYSEAESFTSEKSYKRCLTGDCEEADGGYLEKFILKDETPTVESTSEVVDNRKGGRMMWPENQFEISGCLIRVAKEEAVDETKKEVEGKEVHPCEFDTGSELEISQKTENKVLVDEEEENRQRVIEKIQIEGQKHQSEFTEIAEVVREADKVKSETQEASIEKSTTEACLQTDKVEVTDQVIGVCTDLPAPATEIPETATQGAQETETFESIVDAVIVDAEPEIPKEALRDTPLEISADCEPPVHAHVEVIEKAEADIQTQVCIDLKEEIGEMVATAEEIILKVEDLGQMVDVGTQEKAKTDLEEKPGEIVEQKEEVTSEAKMPSATPELKAGVVKEMVSVGDELILLVPKGQAVEMDIEVSPQPEKSPPEQTEDELGAIAESVMQTNAEKAEVSTKEDVHLPVEESQEVLPKDLDKTETVSLEPSCVPMAEIKTTFEVEEKAQVTSKEDQTLKTEESQAAELKRLEKHEIVSLETTSLPLTEIKTVLEVEEKAQVTTKEDVPLTVDESQAIELKSLEEPQTVSLEPSSLPITEIKTTLEEEDKAQVTTKGDVLLKVEVSQVVELKSLEKQETVFLEPSSQAITEIKTTFEVEDKAQVTTKEDVLLKAKESQVEQLKSLDKQEIVFLETSSQPIPEIKTMLEVEEKAQVITKNDVRSSEDETSVEECHMTELETDLGKPICMPLEEMSVSVPKTIMQVQTAPQLEDKDEDAKPGVDLTVASESEQEMETVPAVEEKIEVVLDEADLKPASDETQKVNDQVMPSVTTETSQQQLSPREAETEELDFEIVTKLEVKESHQAEIETEEPKQVSVKHPDAVSQDLEEGNLEEGNLEEDRGGRSTLKRFTPLEDLSGLHAGDVNLETALDALDQDDEMDISEHVQDVCMLEDVPQTEKKESPDVTMEEYEIITEQDTPEMAQVEMEVEKVEIVKEDEIMQEEEVLEETVDTELMEVDYETIDAEEERQARLAAELEGLDWYCVTCGGLLLSEQDSRSEPHQSHEISAVDQAYDEIMEKVSEWISELQERSENIEDLVSELELAYNSVEDQFHDSEAAMQAQNEEMMALVMEQYNSMSVSMEEEKKAKLEQLYDQIVSFQESIDSAKGTLETTVREADTDARSPEDIHARLTAALDSAMSLELGPKGLLVFEDYAKGNTSSSQLAQRKGIPVPQRPTLQAQEPGSATSSSVTVYWKVNPEDVIDCFQVYCMEDPQGAISEEYRVTVKESYCVLEELEPDKMYKVWVMAVNYTGCSLPSERLIFKTAPSVPVIDTERCTVVWDTAILRWSSVQQTPGLSYTLEYCRQYELEGEGLRTVSGIKQFEQKVLLQPNENYLFYIKAVNDAGSSEQSEAALISTKGTRFHLLKDTAHPALELSVDQTTLHYSQDTHENMTDKAWPLILGEQLPVRGHYYWENDVSRSTDYRLGVVSSTATGDSPLGESQLSWCLQCTPTSTGGSYHLVHNGIHSSLFVIDAPERVGVFLDFQLGRLCFYNALSGQLLGSFSEHFSQPCHPAVGMDAPGSVEVCMVQELPEFVKDS